jgi:deoxyxylulose-5-phosphate synthase
MSYPLLERINAPGEIKNLPASDMPALCEEIRQFLIKSVSETGGHLSSNLGVVELTVALHRVLDFPQDKLLFDVGHQCYTHKLLTGRREDFAQLRRKNGISGFPSPREIVMPLLPATAVRRCQRPSASPAPKSSRTSRARSWSSLATVRLPAAWSTRA